MTQFNAQNGFETADEYGGERNFTLNFKASSRLLPPK